ncbi:hypothetical protein Yangon222_15500 [Helicobacter pylori]
MIDKDFQYICLLAKTNTIHNDNKGVYNFDNYIIVLNTGLDTTIFCGIWRENVGELLRNLDSFYCDFNADRFGSVKILNYPKI